MDHSLQRQRRIAAASNDPIETDKLLYMYCRANGHRWIHDQGQKERHCWICGETQKVRFVYGCIYVFDIQTRTKKSVPQIGLPLDEYVRLLREATARCNANAAEFEAINTQPYKFMQG